MNQSQYTGKPEGPQGSGPESERVEKNGRGLRGVQRATLWLAIAVLLIVGLVLYFRFESGIVPLFGGRG
jgi:hypothetical protein